MVAEDFDKGEKHNDSGDGDNDSLGDIENTPGDTAGFVETDTIIETGVEEEGLVAARDIIAANFTIDELESGAGVGKFREGVGHVLGDSILRVESGNFLLSGGRVDIEIDEGLTTITAHAEEIEDHVERIERLTRRVLNMCNAATGEYASDIPAIAATVGSLYGGADSLRKLSEDELGAPSKRHLRKIASVEIGRKGVGTSEDGDGVGGNPI